MRTKARAGSLGPRNAAARVLAQLLKRDLIATIEPLAGSGGEPTDVSLVEVFDQFPRTQPALQKPCASIEDVDAVELVDDLDEGYYGEQYDEENGRRLVSAEATGLFQVDLWCNSPPERESFEGAFAAIFEGWGYVLVEMPIEALPPAFRGRADLVPVIRLTIASTPKNVDDDDSAMREEWRSTAQVEWDAELLTAADCERLDVIAITGDTNDGG